MTGALVHRHGSDAHAHAHSGPHRHVLRPRRSRPLAPAAHDYHHAPEPHGHSHGLVDETIKRSRYGLRAVALALAVLGLTAAAQTVVFVASGSVALLADLVHNFGDASTAIPLGIAVALRSPRAERWAGLAVVLAIFASACVAGYETIDRLVIRGRWTRSGRWRRRARLASPATGWRRSSESVPVGASTARRSSPTALTHAPTLT
jgi:hypothetical protein